MLPFMCCLELQDLMYLVKSFKDPIISVSMLVFYLLKRELAIMVNLNIVSRERPLLEIFTFLRVVGMWNAIPNCIIDLNLFVNTTNKKTFWKHFQCNFE